MNFFQKYFLITILLNASAGMAQSIPQSDMENRVDLCAAEVTVNPDCLLEFVEEVDVKKLGGVAEKLIPNVWNAQSFDGDREFKAVLEAYNLFEPLPSEWDRVDKSLFRAMSPLCDVEIFDDVSSQLKAMGRDTGLHLAYFTTSSKLCHELGLEYWKEVEARADPTQNIDDLWVYVAGAQYAASIGEYAAAIEAIQYMYSFNDGSSERNQFFTTHETYGVGHGRATVAVIGVLLNNSRLEDAVALYELFKRNGGQDSYFLNLKWNPSPLTRGEIYEEFAGYLEFESHKELVFAAAYSFYLNVGDFDSADRVSHLIDPAKGKFIVARLTAYLRQNELNSEAAAIEAHFAITSPIEDSSPPVETPANPERELLATRNVELIAEYINTLEGDDKYKFMTRAAYKLITDESGNFTREGLDVALPYLAEVYAAQGRHTGYIIGREWLDVDQSANIHLIHELEDSGLFKTGAIARLILATQVGRAYTDGDTELLRNLLEAAPLADLESSDTKILRSLGSLCINLSNTQEYNTCLVVQHFMISAERFSEIVALSGMWSQYPLYGEVGDFVRLISSAPDDVTRTKIAGFLWSNRHSFLEN